METSNQNLLRKSQCTLIKPLFPLLLPQTNQNHYTTYPVSHPSTPARNVPGNLT